MELAAGAEKKKAETFDLRCQTDCPELIKKSSPRAREMVAEEKEEEEKEEEKKEEVRRVRERLTRSPSRWYLLLID